MKIIGIGIDLVETERIKVSIEKFGDRFLTRLFCDAELAYCREMKNLHLHLAARFAAKEAVSKAFGTGIGAELGWRDIEILKKETGAPYITFHGKGLALAQTRGVLETHVSLTHAKNYSVAQVLLVG
ncbi:MAG: holo-ACP synthase [Verrucomicrobiota bacterium]|nr:holo-ACP synthase [Verrucomicrobiota bacterium]